MWRLKRLIPGPFHDLMGWGNDRVQSRIKAT